MSAGHTSDGDEPVLNSQALDRILTKPEIRHCLWDCPAEDDTCDIPYLAGYSNDGSMIYYDRHLPPQLSIEIDGRVKKFNPRDFIRRHEHLEMLLIHKLGYSYWPAHTAANGYERRGVLESLGPGAWPLYCEVLYPYIKADEREKLVKVPRDLDLRPYYAPPVNRRLIAHLQKAMGEERQFSKEEVEYTKEGQSWSHCGPTASWPRGDCAHFEKPGSCELVKGYIDPKGWCKKWKSNGTQTYSPAPIAGVSTRSS